MCFPKVTDTSKKENATFYTNSQKVNVFHSGIYNQNKYFLLHIQTDQICHKPIYFLE